MVISLVQLARRVVRLRCPVCGRGKVFYGLLRGPARCSECGYIFRRRESGYFLMAMGISYFATTLVILITWLLLQFVFKLQSLTAILYLTIAVASFFSIWFFRYSRMLWMALDLLMDPPVDEDFRPR